LRIKSKDKFAGAGSLTDKEAGITIVNILIESKRLGTWSPVMASVHVPVGQVTLAILHGEELALWRNRQGTVQAWENRCPHRGTRFTLGRIIDDELSCGYHGWRFASGGKCTAIPAHPGMTPPKTICAKVYSVTERFGMVWVALGTPDEDVPAVGPLANSERHALFCRSFTIYRSADEASHQILEQRPACLAIHGNRVLIDESDPAVQSILLLQPMAAEKSVAHLWVSCVRPITDEAALKHQYIEQFKRLRQELELRSAA
jgi:nitrite reductase/ring-hydroxylating ferredoxin subunit